MNGTTKNTKQMSYGDLNEHWSGPIYDLTVWVELFNLKKDHLRITSKNPRAKFVDKPTAIGKTWLVARTMDLKEINSEPRYLISAARRVKKNITGDELIIVTKLKRNESKL